MLQRRQSNTEGSLREREECLEQQITEESRVSGRIEAYLKKHYEELADKVDYWMTRHEQDTEMKTKDVQDLKVRSHRRLFSLLYNNCVTLTAQQGKRSAETGGIDSEGVCVCVYNYVVMHSLTLCTVQ